VFVTGFGRLAVTLSVGSDKFSPERLPQ
jgi:hypothetical protein